MAQAVPIPTDLSVLTGVAHWRTPRTARTIWDTHALVPGVVGFTEDNDGFCLTSSPYKSEWKHVATTRDNKPSGGIESTTIVVRPQAIPESVQSLVFCVLRNPVMGLPCASEIGLGLDLGKAGQLDFSTPDLERKHQEKGVAFARLTRVDDGWAIEPFRQQLFLINGQSWPAFVEELKRA
jgi:hypothetical protein